MRNNKGISMVTLIITIVVILILVAITGYFSDKAIDDASKKNTKEEMKNVEEVISIAKAKGMNGEFVPNEEFIVKEEELETLFGGLLSEAQIEEIISINLNPSINPLKKYYLLDQDGFDAEFRENGIVTVSGLKKEYLVSYEDRIILVNDNGTLLSSGQLDNDDPTSSEIKIVFTPNGNTTWAKEQSAVITVTGDNITRTRYTWTNSPNEPAAIDIDQEFASGVNTTLDDKTGNDWYLWVLVEYEEDGDTKRYLERSEAYYIDNTPPAGELNVT